MNIGAFQKLSLIDYPGKISCVIFTRGCNFRCGYCHNPQLVLPELYNECIDENIVLDFLNRRKERIEGVVITGGEPTIHKELPVFIKRIKELGYQIKLDTNGSSPQMIKHVLEEKLVDFIAMDIKNIMSRYDQICGVEVNMEDITESVNIIKRLAPALQFRITIIKGEHGPDEIDEIEKTFGIKLAVQYFKFSKPVLDSRFNSTNEFKWV